MAVLRGGSTIGGYTALHSGLKEAVFLHNVTIKKNLNVKGNITIGSGSEIRSEYNDDYLFKDHSNGNVTISAAGSQLYLGYNNTTRVQLSTEMYGGSTHKVIDTSGRLFYQGQSTDSRYLRTSSDSYVYGDTSGSTSYPRIVFGNSGASSPQYFRANSTSGGLLPYSNGNSFVGTSAWRFKQMHAVDFYENGTKLSSKYATSGHNHDSRYVNKSGDQMSGALRISASGNNSRLTLHNSGSNQADGSGIELLETGESFAASNANGFRIGYDASANEMYIDSKYSGTTRHLTIPRNGHFRFEEGLEILTSGASDFLKFNRKGHSAEWEIGLANGSLNFGTAAQTGRSQNLVEFYRNGNIVSKSDIRAQGNLVADGRVLVDDRIVLNNTNSNYQLQWGSSASLGRNTSGWDWVGHTNGAIRFYDGDQLVESGTNFNVDGYLTARGERVPRIFYGTSSSAPSGVSFSNGDIYIQY